MDNLRIYNKYREVPEAAQKEIEGGRLKGMTDINPMWRIKCLTEEFGFCGIGWKTEICRQWLEKNDESGEVAAYCNINLYIKVEGEWSDPIPGTGGAMFVTKETKGLYTDDEAFKKAYTDAISVACKSLGFGADIYWQKDRTKYSQCNPELDEMLAAYKLRVLIEDITNDRAYLDKLSRKNRGCDYDALDAEGLNGLYQFLKSKQ